MQGRPGEIRAGAQQPVAADGPLRGPPLTQSVMPTKQGDTPWTPRCGGNNRQELNSRHDSSGVCASRKAADPRLHRPCSAPTHHSREAHSLRVRSRAGLGGRGPEPTGAVGSALHCVLESGKIVPADSDATGYPGWGGFRWSRIGTAAAAPGHPRKSALYVRRSGSDCHGSVRQHLGAGRGGSAASWRKGGVSRTQKVRSITTACSRRRRGRRCLLQRLRCSAAAYAGR